MRHFFRILPLTGRCLWSILYLLEYVPPRRGHPEAIPTAFPIGIRTDFYDLPAAAGLGFDFLEIPLDALAALPEADFREFADYAAGAGLRIRSASRMLPEDLPVTGPGVSATALHAYLQQAFGRAARLGVELIVLDAPASRGVTGGVDFPFAWRQLGNFLRICQGHARETGVTVALEPIRKADCNLLNLVSEATLIAGLLQLDNIAVAAHSGHMAMASEPLSDLRRAGGLLRHVHVENALTRRLPRSGDGEDYGRVLRQLALMDYRGGVCLTGEAGDGFEADARAALECLRAAMADAD